MATEPHFPADQSLTVPESDEGDRESIQVILRKRARASKRIAWILDECIRIPGTRLRFGLDPVIGLLPFGGETVATLFGILLLGDAGRKGIPLKTLIRMSGNMLLNAGVGAIPGLGDLFSFWFKSNSRNYQMLREFLESTDGRQTTGGWWPFWLIFLVLGLVLAINIVAWLVLFFLIHWVSDHLLPA